MGFFSRLMTAISTGWQAYNQAGLIPSEQTGLYNNKSVRLMRYDLFDLFYSNDAYKNITDVLYLGQRKTDANLYKRLRLMYNPVWRLVNGYVANIYGGYIDFEKFDTGSIRLTPGDTNPDAFYRALRILLKQSNWRNNKDLYVRTGAKLGDTFIKIFDDTEKRNVSMELLHPGKVSDMEKDSAGNIISVMIEYDFVPMGNVPYVPNQRTATMLPKSVVYTEIINTDTFSFYEDGELTDQYANPYGFVPLIHRPHYDEGMLWGVNCFPTALSKIDELNDQASLLNDAIRKHVDAIWLFLNIDASAVQFSDDQKDTLKAISVPNAEDASAIPLIPQINIRDTGENIVRLLEEIERDYPELGQHKLRDVSNPTAPALKAQFGDAVQRYTMAQSNYDGGFESAVQMACMIGGFQRYKGYEPYGLDSVTKGDLEFTMKNRPIFEDEPSKSERITFLMSSKAPNRAVWKELNIDDQRIAEWEQEAEERRQEMLSFEIGDVPQIDDGESDNPMLLARNPEGK